MTQKNRTTKVCPKCGSGNTIPFIYGEPAPEAFELEQRGEVALGGCCILIGASPAWFCKECENEFGQYKP